MTIRRGHPRPVTVRTPNRQSCCVPARNHHYDDHVYRRLRILELAAWIAAAVSGGFGILQLAANPGYWWVGAINLTGAVVLVLTPQLHRYGELIAPLTFTFVAYTLTFVGCWLLGTDSGLQFYFLVAASIAVLILGIEQIAVVAMVVAVGAVLAVVLQVSVPSDTGRQPAGLLTFGFGVVTVTAALMVVATVWYALRQIARAEAAMEAEYERSEALLTNILPVSIADRLKDPAAGTIADSYADASILFADIADFTGRASQTDPDKLVEFLNRLYTDLDRLVDQHGLEKIKVSGDSYLVVSGVPEPREDHLEALARLALDIADSLTGLHDRSGRPVSLRIGLAAGPVVAGVVGTRRFFYDVWGDAVNLAARMEETDRAGRIQVPQDVYERLNGRFIFEERGEIDVKGKGVMRTWFLVGERPTSEDHRVSQPMSPAYLT